MNIDEVVQIAGETRAAILKLSGSRDSAVKRIEGILGSCSRAGPRVQFPHQWCDFACCVLAGRLCRELRSPHIELVVGTDPESGNEHWWLRWCGYVVDITCDQFEGAPPSPCVDRASAWHGARFSEQVVCNAFARGLQAPYFERACVALTARVERCEEVAESRLRRLFDRIVGQPDEKEKLTTVLGRRLPPRLTGAEYLHREGVGVEPGVLDFWQWSASDLLSNITRGRFAEYVVARAVGASTDGVRDEWAAFDLLTSDGIRLEVKSASFLQSWHQERSSRITFGYAQKRAWSADTNRQALVPTREADVYVFALLSHQDKSSVDPLDLNQWTFYTVPSKLLNERKRSQHSITLRLLDALAGPPVAFEELRVAVRRAAAANSQQA